MLDDEAGFSLSCNTGYSLSNVDKLELLMGPKLIDTDDQMYYDCPFPIEISAAQSIDLRTNFESFEGQNSSN